MVVFVFVVDMRYVVVCVLIVGMRRCAAICTR